MFADADDVADAWRALDPQERAVAETLCTYASEMLDVRFDVSTRLAAGTLRDDFARLATVQMVIRVMRNPSAVRQDIMGPFSVTYAEAASGLLEITEAEARLLRHRGLSRARSIRLQAWTS